MTSQQTRFLHTLLPCLNLCVFKKREDDGQVPGVEEWTPGSPSSFEESEVDSGSVAPWQVCGGCRSSAGPGPSSTDACHQGKNPAHPHGVLGKVYGDDVSHLCADRSEGTLLPHLQDRRLEFASPKCLI